MQKFSEYISGYPSVIEDNILCESGFSRIMQIMSGLVPSVKTFAIITWENPKGIKQSKEINEAAQKKLKEILKTGAHSYVQIKGKYGNLENPVFIMNISKSDAIGIGKDGDQDSIIYGTINKPEDITFEMVYMDGRKPEIRHIWKSLDKDTEDYYSEIKGRKFIIPFFDDAFENKKFINKGEGHKTESVEIISNNNIFNESDFNSFFVGEINKEFDSYGIINENKTGTSNYVNRGYLFNKIRKNKK